ncbi:MAG: hypothetical protein KGN34_00230 [Sphingomonadales bacterium]|nr:hypothetical protein [Sphingomonadales bacterium]
MDLSGRFASAGEVSAQEQEIPEQLAAFSGEGPFAWRDGLPIAVDLDHPMPEPRCSLLPEYLAIAAVFLVAWWQGLSRLIG